MTVEDSDQCQMTIYPLVFRVTLTKLWKYGKTRKESTRQDSVLASLSYF